MYFSKWNTPLIFKSLNTKQALLNKTVTQSQTKINRRPERTERASALVSPIEQRKKNSLQLRICNVNLYQHK
jgi:hypothetical protein